MKSQHSSDCSRIRAPRLSSLFIAAWLIPFASIAIGLVRYHYVSKLEVLVVLLPALCAWLGMRYLKHSTMPSMKAHGYSVTYLRIGFYLTVGIAALGNYLLRLSYGYSGVDIGGGAIQEMYMAALNLQLEGSLSTGVLGTVAHLLRTAQPFALIFGVFLIYRTRRAPHRIFISTILLASVLFAYMASFSRGSVMFYLACILFAAWCLPVSRKKLLLAGGLLVVAGSMFFLSSARDRILAAGIDETQQIEALEVLFDCEITPVSRFVVGLGGPQLLGLGLYLTSSLAEGAHLIMDEGSPMMLGGFTFFPYVNPIKRMLGASTDFDLSDLDHVNMWYSAVGEMYLDFGLLALVIFPAVAILMYRLAVRYKDSGLWGQTHFIITGVYFMLFPLYSVFHSFGLIYAASLVLAHRAHSRRRHCHRRHKVSNAQAGVSREIVHIV